MYLSCLLIDIGENPDRPRPGRLWLRNRYRVHQRLSMAFPAKARKDGDPEFIAPYAKKDFEHVHCERTASSGFLFRVDPQPSGRAVIIVQSAIKPDWKYAFGNAEHLLAGPPQCREYRNEWTIGDVLRFRLEANPTQRKMQYASEHIGRGGRSRTEGKRIGVYGIDEQRKWLDRKAGMGGFEIVDARVDSGICTSFKRGGNSQDKLDHLSVTFNGLLRVTDPGKFVAALEGGIGSAKGFGFGLLSVARLQREG